MNKAVYIIITFILVIVIGIVFINGSKDNFDSAANTISENVEIKDGIQYVTIKARGGYSPTVTTAQANIPTKLVVETNGTYDCSAALVIRSIGYQKILPPTGEVIIDLKTPQTGTVQGLCSMGMYNFAVNFN